MGQIKNDILWIAVAVAVAVAAALYSHDPKPADPKTNKEPFLACYSNACFS